MISMTNAPPAGEEERKRTEEEQLPHDSPGKLRDFFLAMHKSGIEFYDRVRSIGQITIATVAQIVSWKNHIFNYALRHELPVLKRDSQMIKIVG